MENIGVDMRLLVAQLVNFVLFVVLFKMLAAKPFMKVLADEKRKDEERKKLATIIEDQKHAAEEAKLKMQEEMKAKLDESLALAREQAEHTKKELLAQAKRESEELVRKANAQIEEEKRALEQSYREKVVKASTVTVEGVLKDYLTEDMQKKVTERILTNLN